MLMDAHKMPNLHSSWVRVLSCLDPSLLFRGRRGVIQWQYRARFADIPWLSDSTVDVSF